ncbi:MAG: hypothetical protein FJZ56_07620, partial [Chlamydiae bacterium]|nr:hypothetical protein [Chlamydiota bacterium]
MISRKFWETHPALLFAFALLMGQYPPLFLTLPLFFSTYLQDKKKLLLIFSIASLGILSNLLLLPPKIEKPLTGIGYFHIHTLKKCKTSFSSGYLVQGDLKYFENLYDIPISLFYRYKEQIPSLEYDYLIEGTLFQKEDQSYQWKSTKKAFIPIKKTLGLAKKRYEWKETIRSILRKNLTSPQAYAFISALATAETHEYVLPILINKLGLGHLLAISGLHFTCLLAFFSLILLPFCREK